MPPPMLVDYYVHAATNMRQDINFSKNNFLRPLVDVPAHGMVHEEHGEIRSAMQIQHEETDIRGRHFINDESGNMVAEITYAVQHPDTMVVDHTEVEQDLQGQHVGNDLVEAIVEHARAKGRKIIPVCPFVKAVMERKPEYSDVRSTEEL